MDGRRTFKTHMLSSPTPWRTRSQCLRAPPISTRPVVDLLQVTCCSGNAVPVSPNDPPRAPEPPENPPYVDPRCRSTRERCRTALISPAVQRLACVADGVPVAGERGMTERDAAAILAAWNGVGGSTSVGLREAVLALP